MSTLYFMRAVCFCQFFPLSLVHSQCAWLGCRVPLTDSRHLRRPGVDICVPGGLKPVVRALEDQKVRAHRLPPSLPPALPRMHLRLYAVRGAGPGVVRDTLRSTHSAGHKGSSLCAVAAVELWAGGAAPAVGALCTPGTRWPQGSTLVWARVLRGIPQVALLLVVAGYQPLDTLATGVHPRL